MNVTQSNNSKFVPGLSDDDNTVKIYEGVAECTMSDADTLKNVKVKVKDLATQKVQRKIADYVYAFWKDRYLTLPDDEVLSIANEISNVTDVKYNVLDSDDNVLVRAVVTAQVDDNDVMNYIIQFFKERTELKSENGALRKEVAELKAQNESLRNEIENLKRQNVSFAHENSALSSQNRELNRQLAELKPRLANNQQNTSQVVSKDKIALANQKYDKAFNLYWREDYRGAIKLYDEVIQLNPYMYQAYNIRGKCYKALGEESKAEADFSKAYSLKQGW